MKQDKTRTHAHRHAAFFVGAQGLLHKDKKALKVNNMASLFEALTTKTRKGKSDLGLNAIQCKMQVQTMQVRGRTVCECLLDANL